MKQILVLIQKAFLRAIVREKFSEKGIILRNWECEFNSEFPESMIQSEWTPPLDENDDENIIPVHDLRILTIVAIDFALRDETIQPLKFPHGLTTRERLLQLNEFRSQVQTHPNFTEGTELHTFIKMLDSVVPFDLNCTDLELRISDELFSELNAYYQCFNETKRAKFLGPFLTKDWKNRKKATHWLRQHV